MIVGQIKEGIVLDHITAGKGMEIYNVLKLGELDCSVALIVNAESKKMGKKDIIKISAPIEIDVQILGVLDPNALRRSTDDTYMRKQSVKLKRGCLKMIL